MRRDMEREVSRDYAIYWCKTIGEWAENQEECVLDSVRDRWGYLLTHMEDMRSLILEYERMEFNTLLEKLGDDLVSDDLPEMVLFAQKFLKDEEEEKECECKK